MNNLRDSQSSDIALRLSIVLDDNVWLEIRRQDTCCDI